MQSLIGLWKSSDNEHTIRFYENGSFSRQDIDGNKETKHGAFETVGNTADRVQIEMGEGEQGQTGTYEVFFDQELLILERIENKSRSHYSPIHSAANL